MHRGKTLLTALGVLLAVAAPRAGAQVTIQDPTGQFKVGVSTFGNLFDFGSYIGFQRTADGFDPIAPGTPRESWGVSANAVSGFADPSSSGNANLALISSAFGANSGSISVFLGNGVVNQLRVDQNYSFAADNVLKIGTTITNVSGSSQSVQFRRNVDWDIAPTAFNELIHVPAVTAGDAPVVDSSFYGFESATPLAPFFFSGAGGGTFGPSDLGAGLQLDFGTLADGSSVSFNIFHAVNAIGQTPGSLDAEVAGLGGTYRILGTDSNNIPTNSTMLAFGLPVAPAATPEPGTWAMLAGMGLSGMLVVVRRRRA